MLFALISFVIFIAIVIEAPMAGEDYGLTRLFHNETLLERIAYAFDKSQMQLAGWNARLGEQLAIFELSLPRWMSLGIYILSFVAFSISVAMLSSKHDGRQWHEVAAYVAGFTFLLWPGMEVFFWKTANSGYLQTMILTIFVVIPYSDRYYLESLACRKALYATHLVTCLLAGFSFENVPFAVAIALVILCLWQKRKNLINYIPIIVLLVGWFTLITAHSTSVRRTYYAQAIPRNSNVLIHYTERFNDVVYTFFNTSLILFVFSIVSLLYLSRLRLLTKYHVCLVIASVLVIGSIIFSPYTEARSFLFSWCVMFSVICYAFNKATEQYNVTKISFVLLFASICFGVYTLTIYSSYGEKLKSREQGIINSIGTDKCNKGYEIGIINDNHGYRYVNNRDEWYFYNMIGKGHYYGCNITNVK